MPLSNIKPAKTFSGCKDPQCTMTDNSAHTYTISNLTYGSIVYVHLHFS